MSTGRNSPRLGALLFGVGSLHRLPFRKQRLRLLREALDVGFRSFDVAPAYGNGLNEAELGQALTGFRFECQVTTKFGIPVELYGARFPKLFFLIRWIRRLDVLHYGEEYKRRVFSRNEMVRSLEGSLTRLKRDYVDDFMIHEPLGLLTMAEVADLHETAVRLKEQGKILRWGVAGPVVSIKQFLSDPHIDVVQCPLEDLSKVVAAPSQRRIVYGVYRFYRASLACHESKFTTYVKNLLECGSKDLVLATTSSTTLASFRDLPL